MDYHLYEAEDFVLDPDFQKWVYEPSAERELFWSDFVKTHPAHVTTIKEARRLLLTVRADRHELNIEEVSQVQAAIHEFIFQNKRPSSPARTIRKSYVWMKWAAVFTGILLPGILLILWWMTPEQITYATAYNETKTILLPDSSVATLNSNSELVFTDYWGIDEIRNVHLKGEAFFKILPKPQHHYQKFQVITENATVEVIGTSFNVQSRHEKLSVLLKTGKVKLTSNLKKEEVLLSPGQLAELSATNPHVVIHDVNPEHYTAWMSNQVVLNNTSLQELADLLTDRYGYQVTFSDAQLGQRKFSSTAVLSLDDLDVLFKLIEKSFQVQVIQTKEKITIRPL